MGLAEAGCNVRVVVLQASHDERAHAADRGIALVAPRQVPGLDGAGLLLADPDCLGPNYYPDVIVGHGRMLGPYAYAMQRAWFPCARRVHVVHTDTERLELAKEALSGANRMMTAADRLRSEVALAASADLVVGVGPLLADGIRDSLRGLLGAPRVVELIPRLRDWGGVVDPQAPPSRVQVLLTARAEDIAVKGIDLAVRATAAAAAQLAAGIDTFCDVPTLVIRGVPPQQADALRTQLAPLADGGLQILFRPYTTDPAALRADLWQSRLVLMPSRNEGFGLAAYDAIAASVPVLITRESGLARHLRRTTPGPHPEILPVHGPEVSITQQWTQAIHACITDPRSAYHRASFLRRQLGRTTPKDHEVHQALIT